MTSVLSYEIFLGDKWLGKSRLQIGSGWNAILLKVFLYLKETNILSGSVSINFSCGALGKFLMSNFELELFLLENKIKQGGKGSGFGWDNAERRMIKCIFCQRSLH